MIDTVRRRTTAHEFRDLVRERLSSREGGIEHVPLARARGRVLAHALRSSVDLPHFDNSAMDGFAVRSEDALPHQRGTVPVVGSLLAGDDPARLTARGPSAVRIMTGAALPDGYDTVVPLEVATTSTDMLRVESWPIAGAHVRRSGEDIRAGELLVAAGRIITPTILAALAATGINHVTVHRRPRVAIITTGSELSVDTARGTAPGMIIDSNSVMLTAAAVEAHCDVVLERRIGDNLPELRRTVRRALIEGAELVVTTGGIGNGDADIVRTYLQTSADGKLLSVAQRPGSPHGIGSVEGIPVIALPGNPMAAFSSFERAIRPALLAFGHQPSHRRVVTTTLLAPVRSKLGVEHIVPVEMLENGIIGVKQVVGLGSGSHLVARTASAHGYIVLDELTTALDTGTRVDVTMFS